MLPCNNEEDVSYEDCSDDLNRVCSGIENAAEDAAIVLSQISDDGVFLRQRDSLPGICDRVYQAERYDGGSSGKSQQDL